MSNTVEYFVVDTRNEWYVVGALLVVAKQG